MADPESIDSCHICGSTYFDRELAPGEELHCRKCSHVLKREGHIRSLQPALAFSIAGLLLAALANAYPVLTFDVAGNTQSNLLITGVFSLIAQGYWPVALLVFFCAIAAPILHFLSVAYVSAACCLGRRLPRLASVARVAEVVEAWNLVPVFAIACVVAVVKLDMLGTVSWDLGIVWVAILSVCSLIVSRTFNEHLVRRNLEALP